MNEEEIAQQLTRIDPLITIDTVRDMVARLTEKPFVIAGVSKMKLHELEHGYWLGRICRGEIVVRFKDSKRQFHTLMRAGGGYVTNTSSGVHSGHEEIQWSIVGQEKKK